jgi:hypothetical protein
MTKIDDLEVRVEALEVLVSKLSVNNDDGKTATKKENKPRKMTEKGELHKAKLLFYQDKKGSKEVKVAFKKEHNEELKLTFKNWTLVKKITDAMFEQLTSDERNDYVEKAKISDVEDNE